MFSQEVAKNIPPHHEFDHEIHLENEQTPHSHIYPLSGTELGLLCKFLDDMLSKGFIQSSQLPGGAPVLCHDPFPELSHIVIPTLSPLGLLHCPLLGLPNLPGSVPTTPYQAPGAPPSRNRSHSQNPGWNTAPQPWGYGCPSRSLGDYIPLSSPRTPTWIGSDHT